MRTSSAPSPSGFPRPICRNPTVRGSSLRSRGGTRFFGVSTQMRAVNSFLLRFENDTLHRSLLPIFTQDLAVSLTPILSCFRPARTTSSCARLGNPESSRFLRSTSVRCTGYAAAPRNWPEEKCSPRASGAPFSSVGVLPSESVRNRRADVVLGWSSGGEDLLLASDFRP